MAKVQKSFNNSLFTLSLVAVLLLSVFVASNGFSFDIGSRAARGQTVENGTLVLSAQSGCNLGNYALVSSSGQCNSVIASNVDNMLGSRVKVTGVVRDGILYAQTVTLQSREASPTISPDILIIQPSKYPYVKETPIPIDDPRPI